MRRAPRPPGSTGQIAHVHRKSPPGTVSQPHVALPAATPKAATPRHPTLPTWVFPFFRKSRISALGPAPLLAVRLGERFTTRFASFERKVGDFVTLAISRAMGRQEGEGETRCGERKSLVEDGWINKKCYEEEARYTSVEHFRAVKIHDPNCVTQRVLEVSDFGFSKGHLRARLFAEGKREKHRQYSSYVL